MKTKILMTLFVITSFTTFAAGVSMYAPPPCSVTISNVATTPNYCLYVCEPGLGWGGSITITASCSYCIGALEYSINNGASFQSSNTFSDLCSQTTYNIIVRDNGNTACSSSWSVNPVDIGNLYSIIYGYQDADEDGYGGLVNYSYCSDGWTPPFFSTNNLDCDDYNAAIYPGTEGCGTACSMTVNIGADEHLYFGYAPGQCKTKTAVVTEGTAPYAYTWALNRDLLLNVINSSGDETMTGANTASVTVCLLDTAELCVTVTDANGCTATDCATMFGEDVRCFSGNNQKINICHNGNTICIDENALDAHLAHGDYVGICSGNNFQGPGNTYNVGHDMADNLQPEFSVYPNPSNGDFKIMLDHTGSGIINIIDRNGHITKRLNASEQKQLDINLIEPGVYVIQLITDQQILTKKITVVR